MSTTTRSRRARPTGRARSSRRLFGTVLAWSVAAALVPVAAASVTAVPAAAQPAANSCSQVPPTDGSTGQPIARPYDPAAAPLLLPPWGDGSGWINASSYETIMAGDIDGDGWGDLLGRNGSELEVFTPAPPSRSWDQAPFDTASQKVLPPYPRQWVPKSVVSPPPPGTAANDVFNPPGGIPVFEEGPTTAVVPTHLTDPAPVPGLADQSRYETFRLADVNGDGDDELIVRVPVFGDPPTTGDHPYGRDDVPYVNTYLGTQILTYEFTGGRWTELVPTQPVSPAPPWTDIPSYRFGAQQDGGFGMFFLPEYYQSITVGDVDGDGDDDLIGRGPEGLQTWSWSATDGFGSGRGTGDGNLTDAEGMNGGSRYWSTIRVADFIPDPDHKDDLLARTPSGVQLFSYEEQPYPEPALWVLQHTLTDPALLPNDDPAAAFLQTQKTALDDGPLPWNGAPPIEQSSTLRTADLDGDGNADLLALDSTGTIRAWSFAADGTPNPLLGWPYPVPQTSPSVTSSPAYWATLQGGDVFGGSADEVLLRLPDGLHVFSWRSDNGGTLDEVVALRLPQLADTNGWTDPSKYLTIDVVPWATPANPEFGTEPDELRNVLVARDATGVRTFWVNPLGADPAWVTPSAPFPGWAGGTDPTSHGDGTPQGDAYGYLNDQVAKIMNWGPPQYPNGSTEPVYPTIRSKLTEASGVVNWADVATLVSLQPPPSDAIGVSRADFEAIKLQLADWVRDYDLLMRYFFSSSTGVEQLLLTALVVGDQGFPIDEIEQQFSPPDKSRLWALIGDLIWGVLAGLSPELFLSAEALKELKPFTKGAIQLGLNLGGAAAGGLLPYADHSKSKQGQLDVEAAELNNTLASVFCGAIAFLYGSTAAAPTDLGLLSGMGQTLRALPITLDTYDLMVDSLTRQRTVWAYQQFASMNPDGSSGTGWQEATYSIDPTKVDPTSLPVGEVIVGTYAYLPTGKDCNDDANGLKRPQDPMTTLTQGLGVDPADLAAGFAYWDKTWSDGQKATIAVGYPQTQQLDPPPPGMSSPVWGFGSTGWRLPYTPDCLFL